MSHPRNAGVAGLRGQQHRSPGPSHGPLPGKAVCSSAASGLAQGVEGRAPMPVATAPPVEPVQETHSVEQVVDIRTDGEPLLGRDPHGEGIDCRWVTLKGLFDHSYRSSSVPAGFVTKSRGEWSLGGEGAVAKPLHLDIVR